MLRELSLADRDAYRLALITVTAALALITAIELAGALHLSFSPLSQGAALWAGAIAWIILTARNYLTLSRKDAWRVHVKKLTLSTAAAFIAAVITLVALHGTIFVKFAWWANVGAFLFFDYHMLAIVREKWNRPLES